MRQRLTDKVAKDMAGDKGSGIMNDPYQVNNPDHEKNDPSYDEYKKGDPEAWAEGVNKDNLWKKDKRIETNHPAITAKQAAEAVQSVRNMEERAVKCIVASQRILPGAEDNVISLQAADLMHLPDNMIDSLLNRQEELANSIAKTAADTSKKVEEEEDDDDDENGKKEAASEDQKKAREKFKKMIKDKKENAEKEAAEIAAMEKALEEDKLPEEEDNDKIEEKHPEKSAGDKEEKDNDKIEEKHPEKSAGDKEEEEEDKEAASDEKDKEEEEDKEAASDEENEEDEKDEKEKVAGDSLLDDIFSGVTASEKKAGAKTLSGMVKKQASESNKDLSGLWNAPPDVSAHFR